MKINSPEITCKDDFVRYEAGIDFSEGKGILWFEINKRFEYLLSDKNDASLLAMLIPAMYLGEDIYVKGKISEKLYYNVLNFIQEILSLVNPSLKVINIYSDDLTYATKRPEGVATGFSGGIDSFAVLLDHFYNENLKAFKVNHLLYNNVGSHADGGENLFKRRYKRLIPITEKIGLPFVAVNSNMDVFYKNFSFVQTHTPRNLSVPFLLQQGIGRFYYSSSLPYSETFIGPSNSLSYVDPVIIPALGIESLDTFLSGSRYNRTEKTKLVAEIKDSFDYLDVCIDNFTSGNCSTCRKCMNTLVTLDILDKLDNYKGVFNLELYRKLRFSHIAQLYRNNDPASRDILTFSKKENYRLPLSAKLYGKLRLLGAVNRIKKFLK